jgi:hypothetical protein
MPDALNFKSLPRGVTAIVSGTTTRLKIPAGRFDLPLA